jgi:hypothetical protein
MQENHVKIKLTSLFLRLIATCNMNMKDAGGITESMLMEKLGPSPKISRVAAFLEEAPPTTWRRLAAGQLQALPGEGNIRISLTSLAAFLNGGKPYQLVYKRGKRPGKETLPGKKK